MTSTPVSHIPPTWGVSFPRRVPRPPVAPGRSADDYEFCVVTVPRGISVAQARRALTDEAEYGRWELARTQQFMGGGKKVWLRRRIMRLRSPLA